MEESQDTAGIVLLAKLFVHPGREVEFRQFETQAAQIMRKYGGRIERVIRPTSASPGEVLPHEIHLVSFPSMAQFEAYRSDSDLAQLGPLRQAAIAKTEIVIGEEGEPYP
jgi:uncharacterized protein (DUF1330 family)